MPVLLHRVLPNFHAEAEGLTRAHAGRAPARGRHAGVGRWPGRARRCALDPRRNRAGSSSIERARARRSSRAPSSGLHRKPHPGASVEFAEHKEYAPGDEIRHIDWKAVGQVDHYYVKRFEDETEMRTYLLLDASASMGYGRSGVSKLDYASYLAAALAYLLAQQGDPAGLLLFDEQTRHYLPPRTRGGHIRDLLAGAGRGLAGGAHRAGARARPTSASSPSGAA